MLITFDPAKRDATLQQRGLDMGRAGEVLKGVQLTFEDDRQDYGETRNITIGFLDGRMVVLVWTPRKVLKRVRVGRRVENVERVSYRIISMRKANDREKKLYAPRFKR